MSHQTVPADASAVSRADRALFHLERVMALLSGLTILGVMLVSVVNILGRKLFNMPVPGFVDWMEQAVPVIAFLGIAYCQRLGGHIRMDLVVSNLKGRALWLAEVIGVLLILFVTVVLIWGSWLHFERSFDWNSPLYSRDSTIDINLPIWPIKLVIPVMLTFLAIRLGLQVWAYVRAFVRADAVAVAVPRIENAAEQAQAEAETVSGLVDETDDNQTGDRRK
jgi:TRAP-type mannitol/chloroaromatic compound transport system permease small subunit